MAEPEYEIHLTGPCGKYLGFLLPERPSTGYLWNVLGREPDATLSIHDETYLPLADYTVPGAGGLHVFVMLAPAQAGLYECRIPLQRPWNGDTLAWARVRLQAVAEQTERSVPM